MVEGKGAGKNGEEGGKLKTAKKWVKTAEFQMV